MQYSRTELTTVRQMIDAAIVFDEDEPIVDFKLLGSILYIIARQLNVLERTVMIERAKIKKYKMKMKNTFAITEIKVHRQILKKPKDTTTTESATEKTSSFVPQQRRKSSRQRSRSKSKVDRAKGVDVDDEKSKKRGRYTDEDDQEHTKHGRHTGGHDKDSKKRGHHDGHDKDSKKHGHDKDYDSEDHKKHGRHRDGDSKKHGRKKDDNVLQEKILVDDRSAVVTQEQYDKVLAEVRKLQDKYGIVSNIDTSWFNLHKATSITDPRAALNMATRLEFAQRKLNQMIDIVTKFASAIPGFSIDGALGDSQLKQVYQQTPPPVSKDNSPVTEPEEVLLEDYLFDDENLATWNELYTEMNGIKQNVVGHMTEAAGNASETAKNANKLFKQAAPRLSEAAIISVKFARCRVLFDRFTNNATALDVKMSSQMGDCQEIVSQLQFEVQTMIDRIDDALAHPAEDPGAVAAIKDEFEIMQDDLAIAKKNQDELIQLQARSGLDLEIIRKKLEIIRQIKTTRDEALEHLKAKACVDDVNSLLARDQLYALVGFLQQEINRTNDVIDCGEVKWQNYIEELITNLNQKGDRVQVISLHQSLRKYIGSANGKVSTMLDIVGDLPLTLFKKKLDADGNCLSCGTPFNVKLTNKNMKLAKQLMCHSHSRSIKPHVIAEKETNKICYPGRPIPHAADPRALVCNRFCGASISKTEESLTSSLGIDVIDIDKNPAHKADIQNRVHLTCTPCTHSEENLI